MAKILRHPVCANDFNVKGVIYETTCTNIFEESIKSEYIGDGKKERQINFPILWEYINIKEKK